jgi:hypothetical protein
MDPDLGGLEGAAADPRRLPAWAHGCRDPVPLRIALESSRSKAAANCRAYRPAASKVAHDTAPVVARLMKALDGVPDVAGIAAAVDGRVIGVEYFASPKLFSHVRAKLLASYAAQALAVPSSPRPAAPPSPRDVTTFAAGAERGSALVGKAVDPASGRALQTSYLAK